MAPGYLRQRLIVLATKKIRTLLPGFGFFMVSEVGGLKFWAELGQAPCLWRGVHSLRNGYSIGRYAALRKVGVPFFSDRNMWSYL